MKIAIFKRIGTDCSYEAIKPETDEKYSGDIFVRTSEYIEVEFPPCHSNEVIEKQLNALEKAESELRNKFQAALNSIEQQRAELRAITHKPE